MCPVETDPWIPRLRGDEAERAAALSELREVLVRGLTRALPHRYDGCVGAEDVAQLALLKILDSLDSFRGESRFTTWAVSVAVRIAMSEMRRKYYRDISLDASGTAESVRIEPVAPDEATAEQREFSSRVCGLLNRLIEEELTERQRVAIRGALDGLPVEQIAERLASQQNAVYKLLHDARLRLRKGLEAGGFSAEDLSYLVSRG